MTTVNVLPVTDGYAATLYGDGERDDAPALQALFDGKPVLVKSDNVVVKSGGGTIYLRGGEYYLSGTVELGGRRPSAVIDHARFVSHEPRTVIESSTGVRDKVSRGLAPIYPDQFGAAGDGIADDAKALGKAFEEAAASGRPVYLADGKTYASSDLKVPAGVVLMFEPGALLKPVSENTMTIDGQILSAGLQRIFGDGWRFSKTDLTIGHPDVPLEWFGGISSFVSKPDCLKAFNYAIDFCKSIRSRTILLDTGTYYVSGTIRIDGLVGIKGKGYNSTTLFGNESMPAGSYVIELVGEERLNFTDVEYADFVIRSEKALNINGLKSTWFSQIVANQLHFYGCDIGLDLHDTAYSWRVINCNFVHNRTHVNLGNQANNTLFSGCHFIGGERGISITGALNSVTVCEETNFEAISGQPICWSGDGNVINKLSVLDSRFEKCVGFIGRSSGSSVVNSFSFERNYVENVNGTTSHFFFLPDCNTGMIARCYFERASEALLDLPTSSVQVAIQDNVLIKVPKINLASPSAGVAPADGYTRCRAINCSGVKGSQDYPPSPS